MSGPDAAIHRFDPEAGMDDLFLDNKIGNRRTVYPRVGPNLGWEDARRGPIDAAEFVVGMMRLPPEGEVGSHRHGTNEVFINLSDTPLVVYWDDDPVKEETLGLWDVVSVPAGQWRGFRNEGDRDGFILAIAGGEDGGGVEFHPSIIAKARELGFELDQQSRRPDDFDSSGASDAMRRSWG